MAADTFAVVLVAAGLLAAVTGVYAGNRTAYALLASAIFSTALIEAGVPFSPSLWLTIDLVVIMWIFIGWAERVLHGDYGRRRDIAILLFFPAIWPLYFMPWVTWRAEAVDVLVAIQMLLTFPFWRAWGKARQWTQTPRDDPGPLELVRA